MATSTAIAVIAGTTAAAAYLDAKLHISKDLETLYKLRKGARNYTNAVKEGRGSGFYLFQASAHEYADDECIWSRSATYSWRQTYETVCRYGNYFLSLGVKPGDLVGVYSMNSPEYLFSWMGLLSIGAAPALINYNLTSDALLHCVKLSGAKMLLADPEEGCQIRIESSKLKIEKELKVKVLEMSEEFHEAISRCDSTWNDRHLRSLDKEPRLGLQYTSGTTGLPKAFLLTASRTYPAASQRGKTFGQQPGKDRTYHCMPLYHGTGGLAAMNDLMGGISVAVVPKFSTSRFWLDCIESRSTIFIYVGETIRYLLAAPPSPNDKRHTIRLAWGNGLRPDIWERFGIPEIGEFFATTEGNFTTVNHYRNGFGIHAIGHHGWILRQKYKKLYVLTEIDPETGEMWRSPRTGFARRRKYEDGGELLVRMANKAFWPGYWQAEKATESKFVQNVFEKGDLYYRVGDALRRDQDGLWYFIDRLGDTYRWRGENVSTTEVSQVIGTFPCIDEANVYGVAVPHSDGRAGCAAISLSVSSTAFDWVGLARSLRSALPSYAVPLFIRVVSGGLGSMNTGNNKQVKGPWRNEGVDPDSRGTKVLGGGNDRVYWLPHRADAYVPFEREDWRSLVDGQAKL